MEKKEKKNTNIYRMRIQAQNTVLRRGVDRSIVFVTGTLPESEQRKIRGVIFRVANKVEAIRLHKELLALAKEACEEGQIDEFLAALDKRAFESHIPCPTFAEFSGTWMKNRVEGVVRESTLESDKSTLRLHLLPAFGKMLIRDIKTRHIDAYLAQKRTQKHQFGVGYSPASLNNHLGILSRIFGAAIEYEHMERNPVTAKSWQKKKRTVEDARPYWTPSEEVCAFEVLARWKASRPAFAYAIIVQVLCGLRFGELRALEKQDLDLGGPGLWIRRSKPRKEVVTPKNGRARFQFLPESLAREVQRYSLTTKGQLLFPAPSGYEMTNNVLNRAYRRLCEEAGITRITSHGARHSAGSSFAAQGLGQAQIAHLLGHADVKTTSRYTHVANAGVQTLVDARWKLLGG